MADMPSSTTSEKPKPDPEEAAPKISTNTRELVADPTPAISAVESSAAAETAVGTYPISQWHPAFSLMTTNTVSTYLDIGDEMAEASSYSTSEEEDDSEHSVEQPSEADSMKDYLQIEEAKERTQALISDFVENYGKHLIDLHLDPLIGRSNYCAWLVGIMLQLRLHKVWEVVRGDIYPPDKYDEDGEPNEQYQQWQLMKDLACAVIYAHVSADVRETPCFSHAVAQRDPDNLMFHLYCRYGENGDDYYDNSH